MPLSSESLEKSNLCFSFCHIMCENEMVIGVIMTRDSNTKIAGYTVCVHVKNGDSF